LIKFKRIKYSNYLSAGNHPIELKLDACQRTVITGENGAGKTTIISALAFALFGKDFGGINKPLLVNSINKKGLEVEVEFETRGRNYVVKRGIAPNIFEIYMDGDLLSQTAHQKDYQAYIEENVLKLNFNSFRQIVVLGSNNYIPFMRLTAGARREIIEDLLDIKVFSKMNILLRSQIVETKEYISTLDNKILVESEKANVMKSMMGKISANKKLKEMDYKKDVEEHRAKITESEGKILRLQTECNTFSGQIKRLSDALGKRNGIEDQLNSARREDKKLRDQIRFLTDHDECPTCRQSMQSEFKHRELAILSNSENSVKEQIGGLTPKLEQLNKIQEKSMELTGHYSHLQNDISSLRADVHINQKYIEKIEKDFANVDMASDDNVDEFQEKYAVAQGAANTYQAEKDKYVNKRESENAAYMLLKDNGIKTKVIQSYIPYMNALINEYLSHMNFYVNFELDENFKEHIKSRHRDHFSYENFSQGEKQRIDLAILFAWRAVAKKKNSMSTNLLFLDETFDSSMDGTGVDDLMKILYTLNDTNTFVISHKELMIDKFDRILKFEKQSNFSTMKES